MIVIIMAGGLGKRMESDLPKVLHKVYGIFDQKQTCKNFEEFNKPMIVHVINTSLKLQPKKIFIVVGTYKNIIEQTINQYIENNDLIEYVIQEQALGTGHAVKCCLDKLINYTDLPTIILSGDVPLISLDTIINLTNGKNITDRTNKLLVTKLSNPYGCGRIILSDNKLVKIVEEKDCDEEQKLINLVNCGIYQINSNVLLELIPKINSNNKAKEYYLTDIIDLIVKGGFSLDYYELDQSNQYQIKNVNTKKDLEELNSLILNLK